MNKHRDKSDFEINKDVAANKFAPKLIVEKNNKIYISEGDSGVIVRFDPCNNPADVMPIVIKSRIAICPIFLLIGVQHPIVMLIELLTRTHYVQLWKYS